ncbi:MAG: MerR family transcriptional regulator [Oscillospiraceae bacterium]|nr:MerR family transcriptional regulator [Oscillospiraceae bacterium]
MRYKIGDVAGILGISPDLIRYYEEKGVVSPAKDPHNNYRYYDTWDINYLIDCLWYKNFGFGIEQIGNMVSECSYDGLIGLLDTKGTDIMDAIHRQEMLLQRIKLFCERLARTKDLLGKCEMRENAEFVRYINRRNFTYDNSPALRDISRKWLKYMPFSRRYFEIPKDALAEVRGDYEWGFSLGMQYVEEFGVALKPPVEFIPSRLCVHSAFKIIGKDKFSSQHIDYLVEYANQNNLTVVGNAFGNLACSVVEDGEPTGYFEVWLPVKKSRQTHE